MSDTELFLVRHGQANNTAKTEEDYDRLSDLGHEQSRFLGEYLRDNGTQFDRVYCGTLRRHRETVAGMNLPNETVFDERLNEMRYFVMAAEYERTTGTPMPDSHESFATTLPRILAAWESGDFDHVHLPYADFAAQFKAAMDDAIAMGRAHFVCHIWWRLSALPRLGIWDWLPPTAQN